MSLSRDQIATQLARKIETLPFSLACWEGGSAATGNLDQYSDLDLVIAVADGKVTDLFTNLEKFLEGVSPITHKWRLPEPIWHGHSQALYRLDQTPEYFFLDIVVMQENGGSRLNEVERHGTPVVHFDKCQFLRNGTGATSQFYSDREKRLQQIRAAFPFYRAIVVKEMLRGRSVDAWSFYRHLINMLVEAWGMKYRPYRYDFGLRYTATDFPQDIHKKLQALCFVASLERMQQALVLVEIEFSTIVAELLEV